MDSFAIRCCGPAPWRLVVGVACSVLLGGWTSPARAAGLTLETAIGIAVENNK